MSNESHRSCSKLRSLPRANSFMSDTRMCGKKCFKMKSLFQGCISIANSSLSRIESINPSRCNSAKCAYRTKQLPAHMEACDTCRHQSENVISRICIFIYRRRCRMHWRWNGAISECIMYHVCLCIFSYGYVRVPPLQLGLCRQACISS